MWGDAERAATLDSSDELGALLLQISGPAHIALKDTRWQELLHGYEVWIHLQQDSSCRREENDDIVATACASMAKHAATSSNLAALSLHVARMLRDLQQSFVETTNGTNNNNKKTRDNGGFTNKIALVAKARTTAGVLQLLLILIHAVPPLDLEEALVYTSRDDTQSSRRGQRRHSANKHHDAAHELLTAVLNFISTVPLNRHGGTTTTTTPPEVYDATVVCLELLLVLLSSQLYQPMLSSKQRYAHEQNDTNNEEEDDEPMTYNFMLDYIMEEAKQKRKQQRSSSQQHDDDEQQQQDNHNYYNWTPTSLLQTLLDWQMARPFAPNRSIARHNIHLSQSIVAAQGDNKVGPDGMYESHLIVMAETPPNVDNVNSQQQQQQQDGGTIQPARSSSSVILDATRGALVLSSSLLFLPFRLMKLALVLLGGGKEHGDGSAGDSKRIKGASQAPSRINNVVWLTESPVADLAASLLLLLLHNHRAMPPPPPPPPPKRSWGRTLAPEPRQQQYDDGVANPFRAEMAALNDNRWEDNMTVASFGSGSKEGLQTIPLLNTTTANETLAAVAATSNHNNKQLLMVNFEKLFESFGTTLHTEVGALLLYTLLQSSPMFATSIAVRSDLDTLVLPLLRTLYFSSSLKHHYYSQDATATTRKSDDGTTTIINHSKTCSFRSLSQLYVIMILLLILTQDASFGPDAFRRVYVKQVKWYKERQLRHVNLGSLVILVLLRSITLNLNRLHDAYLLSNSCASLLNLAPHVAHVHDYAAMRLVDVTMSCMKKYVSLVNNNKKNIDKNTKDDDDDLTSPLGMYGEVTRTLLTVLRHCVSAKNIAKNLHVVYALVYHQADFNRTVAAAKKDKKKVKLGNLERLTWVIATADKLIQDDGDARTAPKAFGVLQNGVETLQQEAPGETTKASKRRQQATNQDDFSFSYEEEADPEIFFLPYIWEVIVCVTTSGLMDWNVNRIQVFELLQVEEQQQQGASENKEQAAGSFADNVDEVV